MIPIQKPHLMNATKMTYPVMLATIARFGYTNPRFHIHVKISAWDKIKAKYWIAFDDLIPAKSPNRNEKINRRMNASLERRTFDWPTRKPAPVVPAFDLYDKRIFPKGERCM